MSHSARGAWIETTAAMVPRMSESVALREGCVDRNFSAVLSSLKLSKSHSARGAWIETIHIYHCFNFPTVALREGCVDRNPAIQIDEKNPDGRTPRGVRG